MALQNHRRNLLHRNRFRLIAQDGCFKQYIDITVFSVNFITWQKYYNEEGNNLH